MCAQYVTDGAKIKCSCGSKTAYLQVLPDRTVILTDGHYANISDHQSMVNIPPFGLCRSLKYPPTKSATDAHHGSLTPMPCQPGTYSLWQNGNDSYIIRNFPALLTSSYCRCIYGGVITIVSDGQVPDKYEIPKVNPLQKEEIKSAEDEERGLDAIDFIPVVGSIRDIGDGIASGSMGLVALGAVFLVADIAGLAGSVFSGGAATVGVTAAKTSVKAGVKVAAKKVAKESAKQAVKQTEKNFTENIAKGAAKQTSKQVEKKLFGLTAKETTEGASKLATEAAEKAAKGLNPFNPNLLEGVTKIAEKGASVPAKSPKGVSMIDETLKALEKSSKGILDTGLKQIDEIGKAGKEYFKAGRRVIKRGLDDIINEVKRPLDNIEKLRREQEKVAKMKRYWGIKD